jgi:hypothetical protein
VTVFSKPPYEPLESFLSYNVVLLSIILNILWVVLFHEGLIDDLLTALIARVVDFGTDFEVFDLCGTQ